MWPRLIAFIVLVVIGIVINFAVLAHHGPRRLDGQQVATLISQAIQAQSGGARPPQVSCAANEPVRAGYVFACQLLKGGATVPVQVTETDNQGQFTWRELPAVPPTG